jgi:hypothetical protein
MADADDFVSYHDNNLGRRRPDGWGLAMDANCVAENSGMTKVFLDWYGASRIF